ncbi:MAG: hypothetical protein H6704_30395 [Myxococcales bacterium]|nr:hypothetical protein [Myxococcales bacterium]
MSLYLTQARPDGLRPSVEPSDAHDDERFDRAVMGLLAMNHKVIALIESAWRDLVHAATHPHGYEADMNPFHRSRTPRGRASGFRPRR